MIDPTGRVLMINEAMNGGRPYWLVPGGGVEELEDPRAAAVRETLEETGLRVELAPSAPVVHTERRTWSYGGCTFDQTNHFFALEVSADPDLSPAHLTDLERESFLGFRWWHPDEIEQSDEQFYPVDIAALVRRLGRRGPV
jgi:8-oxo-dGTP pyrophosphatase MutT (NUDIX family)